MALSRVRGVGQIVRHRLPWGRSHVGDSPLPFVSRSPSVKPILPVADMAVAIAYYEKLGFDVKAYDEGYAWVRHCGWEFLHLALAKGVDAAANEAAAYIHVADADAWYTAMVAVAPDAEISHLADTPWGMREYSFTDPSGNRVRIGQNL